MPVADLPDVAPPPSTRGEPAWEIAMLHPVQGEWSEAEYLSLETNRLVEFDDGLIEVLPMPTWLHDRIIEFLHLELRSFVKPRRLGAAVRAPFPVLLWGRKYREPDVLFLPTDQIPPPDQSYLEGIGIAFEVVSPGAQNRDRDLVKKVADYAKARVPEYWIVDPELQRITVLILDGDEYRTHGEFESGQKATSVLLDGFAVNVDEVFSAADPAGNEP